MARIHGRFPCDWTIGIAFPGRYTLSLSVPLEQAHRIAARPPDRGVVRFRRRAPGVPAGVYVSGIRITRAEADAIRFGASPLDLICGADWTGCGYRLTVVTAKLGEE
jgi:hypothetical protein